MSHQCYGHYGYSETDIFLPFTVYNCHLCHSVCLHKFSERLHNLLSTNGNQSLFLILCPLSAAMNFKNFEFGLL